VIFPYHCYECGIDNDLTGKPFHPPMAPQCPECYSLMDRVYGCVIDTSGCKDHDEVAPEHRISVSQEKNISSRQTAAVERSYAKKIAQTRRDIADGGNRGTRRMTHQIPAALHAAKIKESGDRTYWDDPKNRARHRSCKVD